MTRAGSVSALVGAEGEAKQREHDLGGGGVVFGSSQDNCVCILMLNKDFQYETFYFVGCLRILIVYFYCICF